ncbi:MAG TPA: hypothetical protein VGD66_05935 [Allosphingosinicella sp.]|jgi:hypothetical protein
MAYEIPRRPLERGWEGRTVAAAIVFGFFVWLWIDGGLGRPRLDANIVWTIPLFVLGFLAYEAIAHTIDGLLAAARRRRSAGGFASGEEE